MVVHAEGPTRVLAIINEEMHPINELNYSQKYNLIQDKSDLTWQHHQHHQVMSNHPLLHASDEVMTMEGKLFKYEKNKLNTGFEFIFNLKSIGLSLVSETKDLLYIHFSHPKLRFASTRNRNMIECAIDQFQIDNCNRHAVYPVSVRCPTSRITLGSWRPGVSKDTIKSSKAVHINMTAWKKRPGEVICIEKLDVFLAPLALEIEEEQIRVLYDFFKKSLFTLILKLTTNDISCQNTNNGNLSPDMTLTTTTMNNISSIYKNIPKSKIYIEHLFISKLDISLSFSTIPWTSSSTNNNNTNFKNNTITLTSNEEKEENIFFQKILSFANIDGARISLSQLELRHPLLSQQALSALFGRHYTKSLLQEVYKIVGSADILGDPVRLIHHLGLGVWSLFANPAYALVDAEQKGLYSLFLGISSGLQSFLLNTIFGFSNATVKMSLAAGKSLAILGLEKEGLMQFVPRGSQLRARFGNDEKSIGLLDAILSGLAGIVAEPVKSIEKNGLSLIGVVRGCVKGLVGSVIQPLAVTLGMLAIISENVRLVVSGDPAQVNFIRVPRPVSLVRPLSQYDKLEAMGYVILDELKKSINLNQNEMLGCFLLDVEDMFVMVTEKLILSVKWKEPLSPYTLPVLHRSIPVDNIVRVNVISDRIVEIFGYCPAPIWKRKNHFYMIDQNGPFFTCKFEFKDIAHGFFKLIENTYSTNTHLNC